jgi:hypothetical protein
MGDPEIEAMSAVTTALADLDEDAQGRVLRWAAERYGVTTPMAVRVSDGRDGAGIGDSPRTADVTEEEIAEESPTFRHFAELFAKAQPKSDADKALVAAYWMQVQEGQSQWQSRRLSTELKHLGHSVKNVTTALTSNINKKPQRVIQLKKSGSAKQANKTYKVTNEGIVYVQGMLSGGNV